MYCAKRNKLTALLIVALLALTCLIAACDEEAFQPLDYNPTVVSVESNGGIAVKVSESTQDWYYYVNGYQSTNSGVNAYDTEIRVGQICRIKATDLATIIDLNLDENDTELETTISEAVYEKSEIVVPYVFYSGSTTAYVEGIFIFNDRLYYKTPNYYLDTTGTAKSSELMINSCKLDGSDTRSHFSLPSTTITAALMEKNGTVYALYTNTATVDEVDYTYLYCVNLSQANATATVISEEEQNISSLSFDLFAKACFYLNEDGDICTYEVGGEVTVLKEAVQNVTYAIAGASKGTVFYTKTSTVNKVDGVFSIKKGGNEEVVYSAYTNLTSSTGMAATLLCYNTGTENVLIVTCILATSATVPTYELFVLKTDGTREFLLPEDNNTSAITLLSIDGDDATMLHYSIDTTVYTIDLSTAIGATVMQEPVLNTMSACYADIWASYDVIGDYTFMFDETYGLLHVISPDGEDGTFATELSYVEPEEDEEEE